MKKHEMRKEIDRLSAELALERTCREGSESRVSELHAIIDRVSDALREAGYDARWVRTADMPVAVAVAVGRLRSERDAARREVAELLPWAHAAAELFADPVRARIWRHQKEASAFLERIDDGEFGPVPAEVA